MAVVSLCRADRTVTVVLTVLLAFAVTVARAGPARAEPVYRPPVDIFDTGNAPQ